MFLTVFLSTDKLPNPHEQQPFCFKYKNINLTLMMCKVLRVSCLIKFRRVKLVITYCSVTNCSYFLVLLWNTPEAHYKIFVCICIQNKLLMKIKSADTGNKNKNRKCSKYSPSQAAFVERNDASSLRSFIVTETKLLMIFQIITCTEIQWKTVILMIYNVNFHGVMVLFSWFPSQQCLASMQHMTSRPW